MQYYVIKFVSDLRRVSGFLQFPPPIKLTASYNCNIVESDVKHHKPTKQMHCMLILFKEIFSQIQKSYFSL